MKTIAQASEELNVSQSTVRSWIAKRRIEFVKLGRCVRIPQHVIDRLVSSGTVKPVRSEAGAGALPGGAE